MSWKRQEAVINHIFCPGTLPQPVHHVYQDNYYNSAEIAEKLIVRKIRFYGTVRANRGFL
jgi:hypothetical protein